MMLRRRQRQRQQQQRVTNNALLLVVFVVVMLLPATLLLLTLENYFSSSKYDSYNYYYYDHTSSSSSSPYYVAAASVILLQLEKPQKITATTRSHLTKHKQHNKQQQHYQQKRQSLSDSSQHPRILILNQKQNQTTTTDAAVDVADTNTTTTTIVGSNSEDQVISNDNVSIDLSTATVDNDKDNNDNYFQRYTIPKTFVDTIATTTTNDDNSNESYSNKSEINNITNNNLSSSATSLNRSSSNTYIKEIEKSRIGENLKISNSKQGLSDTTTTTNKNNPPFLSMRDNYKKMYRIQQQQQQSNTKSRLDLHGIFALTIPRKIPEYCWNVCRTKIIPSLVSSSKNKNLLVSAAAIVIIGKGISSEPVRRTVYFWTHVGPIIIHYRFTKWWMRINSIDIVRRNEIYETLHNKYSQPTYNMILHLKGLYVKIGQILSSRPDFVPYQYVTIFSQLQDSIPQSSITDIEQIIQLSFQQKKDSLDYKSIFLSIDPIALGSASIGQVHKATLHPEWSRILNIKTPYVAIKVMHPSSKLRFTNDFQVFRWLCRVTLPGWRSFLDTLEKQIMTEFDYRTEAQSLEQVRLNMLSSQYSSKVCVPQPFINLCTQHVLVMEYLHGIRLIDSIEEQLASAFHGSHTIAEQFMSLKRTEVVTGQDLGSNKLLQSTVSWYGKFKLLYYLLKCRSIIDILVNVHGYQIFVNGCWNGDPHAGNFLLLNDGRIGLIDYGQTKRISNSERLALAKIIVAIDNANNNKDDDVSLINDDNGTTAATSSTTTTNAIAIAAAMKDAGFTIQRDDTTMLTKYAKLFFDSDEDGLQQGCVTPQHYFARLMFTNPLTTIPDSAGT
jgi:aarF domain-containing kinase